MENKLIDNLNITGLNDNEVKERYDKGLSNICHDTNEKSTLHIILSNTFTFFNIILFSIAIIFLVLTIVLSATGNGDFVNKFLGLSKFIFLIPALMNVIIGTTQELHSRRIIRSLKIVTEAKSKVIRNNKTEIIDSSKLVMDDIVILCAGEQATADLELIDGEVSVDESMLTGESDHIKKTKGDKILSGSAIIVGEAKAKVVEVGDKTYASKLSQKVKSSGRHKSVLIDTIYKIMKILAVAILIVTIVIFSTLIYKIINNGSQKEIWDDMEMSLSSGTSWARIIITTASFAVGIIPSGLVLTTSVTLMLSIVSLSRKETLIQELYSLENLSRVDVICLDKTGTLTDGTMNVCEVKRFDHLEVIVDNIQLLISTVENRNQTLEALYKYFGKIDNPEYKELIPFSSANKCSGLITVDDKKILLGAPEYLLSKDDERLEFVKEKAQEGKRVLAFLYDNNLIAFFVIEDHIRDTAKDTLNFFRENGVDVKVISGDNPLTVSKIAKDCGIVNYDKYISLEGIPLEDIDGLVDNYTIFARVSPEQKEAIVKALQKRGHKVAMTGDGVNDILALRKSDFSISFANATEAAKSVSDVVLLDNDFSHLKDVVGEGRRVISNIQRTAILYLMKSIAVIIFAFALIPFAKGQMWFTIENTYILEATVVGTGGFLISLESKKTPIKGSFIKNIRAKSISAGILAAFAILLPVMLYRAPLRLGYESIIYESDVRTMMTILLAFSGFVVLFSMCVPFNRYRTFTMILTFLVATLLSFMFPTSFVGGIPTNADSFNYDASIGQTIFDCQFVKEFFRPWNSPVISNLFANSSNILLIRVFIFVITPLYLLLIRYIDFKLEHEGMKFRETLNLDSILRTLLLACGIGLIIEGIIVILQTGNLFFDPYIYSFLEGDEQEKKIFMIFLVIGIMILIIVSIYLFLGILGYKIWKTNKRIYKTIAFIFSVIALIIIVGEFAVVGFSMFINDSLLLFVDNLAGVIITVVYSVSAIILRIRAKKSKKIDVSEV